MKIENFSLREEIKKFEDAERRDLNIIGLFLSKKKPDIKTTGQLQVLVKRHIRDAKLLAEFDDIQILNACDAAERVLPGKWTLGTLVKLLTK